ncbi:hypothetical protein C7999DRAFT_12235 [Corynascus novoguineensis]|uniref:Conserved oligomeric Golgi complex subunit 1 n=1 Tax=Corynascus novoguineensis TaxID=1126955 RepID=A0AAN7CXR9_9PEZI|nr:hypothetical protein C7999DRAFT_12235 [Corynascus novoguineensis]
MATLPPNLDLSTIPSSAALFSSSTSSSADSASQPHPAPGGYSYTLPQIRAIHRALHAQADDLAARARTRVGASYRDLLGTADTIVAMRADAADGVLLALGGMGARCGRGVVAAKAKGLRDWASVAAEEEFPLSPSRGEDQGSKVGSRGEALILGARLYVLGRLLVKSLEGPAKQGGKLDAARKSLENVHRGRLMRSIDALLRSGSERAMKQGDVLRVLTAYSLATSSGARDVLAHFLSVRAQAIAMALELDAEERAARNPKEVLKALGLYAKTLLDVQALVPNRLTEALVALKADRLLENESLKEMEVLRLDIYKRWCGDEIQFYTPFIRHDDLDGEQAREMLAGWAKKGSEVLLQGLEKTLESMNEFKAIVELRTSLLKLWIAEGGKARGFDPSEMLDELREAINKHLLRVVETKVTKLRLVGSEVSAALDAWREGITDRHQSLWEVDSIDTTLSNGAAQFTHDAVSRLYGRNDAVSKAVTSYKSWFHVIDDVSQVVDQLKRQRWDNDVEEIEDEETIEERQKLLSKDDPLALSKHLNRLLIEAFRRLDDQLTTLWNSRRDGPENGAIAMYFVRLLRDIRAKLPDLEEVRGFGLSAVPSLHEAVARTVVVSPLDDFIIVALAQKKVVGRSLWEGEPALPGSPSPGIFKFLRNLTIAMGDAGGDLWSPAAVGVLKQHLGKHLSVAWLEALGTLNGSEAGEAKSEEKEAKDGEPEVEGEETVTTDSAKDGTAGKSEASSAQKDLLVQWLMDIYYLRMFLGSEETMKELEETVQQKAGLESSAKERLAKASQDYFKRTSLLFGLLI